MSARELKWFQMSHTDVSYQVHVIAIIFLYPDTCPRYIKIRNCITVTTQLKICHFKFKKGKIVPVLKIVTGIVYA